jgi:hypothetical protein
MYSGTTRGQSFPSKAWENNYASKEEEQFPQTIGRPEV